MSTPRVFKFFAFISYSRKDAAFAEKLQNYLDHFKLPSQLCKKYPEKPTSVRPIYRDKTDLVIDKLNDALKSGLEVSKYLIVICSENSARPNAEGRNWIDEEVRTFVSIDPENVHRIIPILLRDKNSTDALGCMPQSIKELGLLAADIQDKGTDRVFSDVAAKMLDLGPDELWDRVGRELRRRRRVKRIAQSLAAALVAGTSFFAWDFCYPKVSYYRDYVECYNVPVGINELTQEQIAGLQFHYRFTEQFYKVQTVECCNSVGTLSEAKYAWVPERPVAMRFKHDYIYNRVLVCDYLNKQGKVVTTLNYPVDDPKNEMVNFVQKDDVGKIVGSGFAVALTNRKIGAASDGLSSRKPKAEVTQMIMQRDNLGRVISERFLNNYGYPCQNAEGCYGHRYERDASGRMLKLRYLSHEGKELSTKQGIAGIDLAYNARGLAVSLTYVDEMGNAVLAKDGYACIEFEYDASGNLKQTSFRDTEGKLCLHKEGFAGQKLEYDSHGNLVRKVYYGIEGEPCLDRNSIAGARREYDSLGNEVKCVFTGTDGKPCLHKVGFAGYESEYDSRGNIVKRVFTGIDGKPCLHKDGVAGCESEYDSRGNEVKCVFTGTDGKPCLHKDGFAGWEREYDARGNEVKRVFTGTDGKPCLHKDGFAGWEREYDSRGNEVKRVYTGTDGKPCLHKDGVAGWEREYDSRGNIVKRVFIGTDGKPCLY